MQGTHFGPCIISPAILQMNFEINYIVWKILVHEIMDSFQILINFMRFNMNKSYLSTPITSLKTIRPYQNHCNGYVFQNIFCLNFINGKQQCQLAPLRRQTHLFFSYFSLFGGCGVTTQAVYSKSPGQSQQYSVWYTAGRSNFAENHPDHSSDTQGTIWCQESNSGPPQAWISGWSLTMIIFKKLTAKFPNLNN